MAQSYTRTADVHPRIADRMQNVSQGLLASERSYLVAQALIGRTSAFELRDLAETVTIRESGLDAGDEAMIRRVEISLHHLHLPKLDEIDVLDYDPEARVIEP